VIKLKISPKQKEILKVLEDKVHTEIFAGGSAGGCFLGDVKVLTENGYLEISKVMRGMRVFSFDKTNNKIVLSPIKQTFINGGSKYMIRVTLNGDVINATETHKFLYNGKWIELGELVRRNLEGNNRVKWNILDKQQRQIKDNKLEKFWRDYDNEPGYIPERLFKNCIGLERKESSCSTTSPCNQDVYSKPREQITSESQRLQQKKQQRKQSGMGHSKRKLSVFDESPETREFPKEYRQREESSNKKGIGQPNKQTNRRASQRNKNEIQTKDIWKKETRLRIQRPTMHDKRHNTQKVMEARSINFDLIEKIEFYLTKELTYDLEVENTESYIVSDSNIIVHNSKSFTGCLWQLRRRLEYPGSRGYLARARLKNLKQSTLLTFFEVCKMLELVKDVHYTYNANDSVIKFFNGSEEYLKDLFLYPSDPEFVSLGSTEYTDGFIDEMGEITEQAYEIIKSRVRYKLDEFNLIPKTLMGSNPCKTFVYREFYKKWETGTLEKYKSYIRASVYDNPFISEHYIDNLKRLDSRNRERLLNGNWNYDDDPTKLFEYDAILDLFTLRGEDGDKFLTGDISGDGKDRTTLFYWKGLHIYKIEDLDNISSQELDKRLLEHQIPRRHCVLDNDGVGYGIVKDTPGVKGFVNNGSAIKSRQDQIKEKKGEKTQNYKNLKAQCWFLASEYVRDSKIGCYRDVPNNVKTKLIEDLEHIKEKDPLKDTPKAIISKEEIKENLGRSTDFGDSLMMRMFFEVNKRELAFSFA